MTVEQGGCCSDSIASILHTRLPNNLFMILGMPYLVYIREAREDDLHLREQLLIEEGYLESPTIGEEADLSEYNREHKRFAIFAANGECLAIVQDKDMAVAWAKENNLSLQSVH